jgi:hypothetical protein
MYCRIYDGLFCGVLTSRIAGVERIATEERRSHFTLLQVSMNMKCQGCDIREDTFRYGVNNFSSDTAQEVRSLCSRCTAMLSGGKRGNVGEHGGSAGKSEGTRATPGRGHKVCHGSRHCAPRQLAQPCIHATHSMPPRELYHQLTDISYLTLHNDHL